MKTPERSRISRVSQIVQSFCPVFFCYGLRDTHGLAARELTDTQTHMRTAPILLPRPLTWEVKTNAQTQRFIDCFSVEPEFLCILCHVSLLVM